MWRRIMLTGLINRCFNRCVKLWVSDKLWINWWINQCFIWWINQFEPYDYRWIHRFKLVNPSYKMPDEGLVHPSFKHAFANGITNVLVDVLTCFSQWINRCFHRWIQIGNCEVQHYIRYENYNLERKSSVVPWENAPFAQWFHSGVKRWK